VSARFAKSATAESKGAGTDAGTSVQPALLGATETSRVSDCSCREQQLRAAMRLPSCVGAPATRLQQGAACAPRDISHAKDA
jgi:hypothetical protein